MLASSSRRALALAVVLTVGAGSVGADPKPQHPAFPEFTVDAATRDEVVRDVLAELDQKYVFPNRAAKNRPELEKRWSSDAFRQISSGPKLIETMTADLQALYHDKHLGLVPASVLPPSMLGPDHDLTPGELAEERGLAAKVGFGVTSLKVLGGNIGYIEIIQFPSVQIPEVGKAIADAMAAVADTDGLIIDLRKNHGGEGETVALLVSYLLDEKKLLLVTHDRTTGKSEEDWTLDTVPGRRYGGARPVWVLTSSKTFSAAEELAYDLKTLGRGVVVGERTGGGANQNMFVLVGKVLVLSVAYKWVESPVTKTNWEGVGVQPDVEVAADKALETALAAARKKPRPSKSNR